MSKELEALKEIKASHLQAHIDSKNIGNFDIWFDEYYETIKQALTPPTADELCEELSAYFEQDVKCIYGMFYYGEDLQFTEICNTTIDALNGDQLYDIYLSLPATLLKRIAQFYENEVK